MMLCILSKRSGHTWIAQQTPPYDVDNHLRTLTVCGMSYDRFLLRSNPKDEGRNAHCQ